jgi:hypothetical protein
VSLSLSLSLLLFFVVFVVLPLQVVAGNKHHMPSPRSRVVVYPCLSMLLPRRPHIGVRVRTNSYTLRRVADLSPLYHTFVGRNIAVVAVQRFGGNSGNMMLDQFYTGSKW